MQQQEQSRQTPQKLTINDALNLFKIDGAISKFEIKSAAGGTTTDTKSKFDIDGESTRHK